MKIRFLGAAQTVTGSCHCIEVDGKTILLDCGLFQGKRKESFQLNRTLLIDPKKVDAVVLSHAHIDHSGRLPILAANGYSGRIFCTEATRDLAYWMLLDSAMIQEKDVEHVNKIRARDGKKLFEPLYSIENARQALATMEGIAYDREVQILPGVHLRFEDAGHILGSASCHLRIQEGSHQRTLVFTGDIGRNDRPILRDPVPPTKADILITESTYGDRLHGPVAQVRELLQKAVQETYQRGGKLLIPAFSVGRTQRLVYDLNQLHKEGKLPNLPVFVDSPLAANATQVFHSHPECYDQEASEFYDDHEDNFGFSKLTYIRDVEASKAIRELQVPYVLISASGMCEAGRVLHHLKYIAPNPKNTILITGFMAEHTLGRQIVEKKETIKIYGEPYPLRAEVRSISGFSAHADRNELLSYLSHFNRLPKHTFLVHGEIEKSTALAEGLKERDWHNLHIPSYNQSFEI